jgi:hypothetical protein
VVGGGISIEVDGGITELDPAGDRLLLDISGFVDERDVRRTVSRVPSEAEPEPPRGKIKAQPNHGSCRLRFLFDYLVGKCE